MSRALRGSREQLILLEGEPGAGKSVALRHLATVVASAAKRSRSTRSTVPLYINLKSIDRPPERAVDAELIREHVLKTLKAPNVRDVEEFLDDEFARGFEEGTWLFLFDSFDEIPDVLSATTADTSIRDYAQAIATFLTSMNACRGIVASRYFRGPGSLGWPRFRILALSDEYRRRLIRRADLPVQIERDLVGQLELAGPALAVTSRNPMFLGLLCQHLAKGNPFPDNTHVVFEDYVDTRLRRDEAKLLRRYGVGSELVREAAEQAAFCMAYHPTLGLSPTREALALAMKERGYTGEPSVMFDALEFIKLARPEGGTVDATFTFAHRRFQEYFATSVVLDAPEIVTPERLLTDARWRETAVVLLQTQTGERLARIVTKLQELLEREVAAIEAALPSAPISYPDATDADEQRKPLPAEFPWPPLALHLMSLLQSGYQGRAPAAPAALRDLVGRVVYHATVAGTLLHRKWALEVAGISPRPVLARAIRAAFTGYSRWLAEVAYRQAALLPKVERDIARAIRFELLHSFVRGRLPRERDATFAHVQRLPHSEHFVGVARLLLYVPRIDACLHALLFFILLRNMGSLLHGFGVATALGLSAAAPYGVARVWVRVGSASSDLFTFALAVRAAAVVPLVYSLPETAVFVVTISLWSPFAVLAATSGTFVAIRFWPLLSAFPILALFAGARTLVSELKLRLVLRATAMIAAFAVIAYLTINPHGWPLVETVKRIILILFLLAFVPAAAAMTCQWVTAQTRDVLLWRQQVHRRYRFDDAAEMSAILTNFATATWQARFVERVVERSMLDPAPENQAAVRELAIEFEIDPARRRPRFGTPLKLLVSLRLQSLVDGLSHPATHARITDALNVLAEQLRLRSTA